MILYSGRSEGQIEKVIRDVFYPLWDIGFEVGHAARTQKEAFASAKEFESMTSYLTSRLVAGDEKMFADFHREILNRCRRGGIKKFALHLRDVNEKRYGIFRENTYLLEPDIKNGMGGLRDIQSLRWLNTVAPQPLLSADELSAISSVEEFLLHIRNHLHIKAGRKMDRLFLDNQEDVAKFLDYKSDGEIPAVEIFMKDYYSKVGLISHMVSTIFEELSGKAKMYSSPLSDPSDPIKVFAGAAESGQKFNRKMLESFRSSLHAPINLDFQNLIRILKLGDKGLSYLELMNHTGILDAAIPHWKRIKSLSLFDLYHLYTVDMHCFITVAELDRIRKGKHDTENPLLSKVAKDLSDHWDTLLIAALMHDIGKGTGNGHSKKGARIVSELLGEDSVVPKLIMEHLTLSDLSMRRDTNDENLMFEIASRVDDPDSVKMLYLLTVADSLATGPKAWSPIKDVLVTELFLKILSILESSDWSAEKENELKSKREKLRKRIGERIDPEEADRYVDDFTHEYLQAFGDGEILDHFVQIKESAEDAGVKISKGKDYYELLSWAKSPRNFLSKISGVLSLNGVNIISAGIYRLPDGFELGCFLVHPQFEKEISGAMAEDIESGFKRAMSGRISLDRRVGEKAKIYEKNSPSRPVTVQTNNEISGFYSVIEVKTTDRIGLLYDISRALDEFHLSIRLAKVSTAVDKVVDVFYVLDEDGEKITDKEQIADIEKGIEYRLAKN